jgi:hypothetical protein
MTAVRSQERGIGSEAAITQKHHPAVGGTLPSPLDQKSPAHQMHVPIGLGRLCTDTMSLLDVYHCR